MADPTEEPRPDDFEEGGGPVKTFLEHLEDLRWLLVKSGVALLVCLVVCLYGAKQIVWILERPLKKAALIQTGQERKVIIRYDTNVLHTFTALTNRIGPVDLGTNWVSMIQLEPVQVGTNVLLSLNVHLDPPDSVVSASGPGLIYIDPAAPFMSVLHLGLYGALLMSSPVIFFFLAQFILPALKVREKKYVLRAAGVGAGLFLAGVAVCYFWVMERALKFAELFALWMGVKVPEWRADTYFSFVTKFMLGMGLGFELPVVLLALVKIGILDYARLAAMRRYMIVINLILGALLTTPEVFTQVVMAVILQVLYEISVCIAWYWEWRDRRREAAEAADETS